MNRDFTDDSYEELVSLVKEVEDEKWCNFTDWVGDRWYDFESWIGTLSLENYLDDVNSYHKKVIDKNNASVDTIKTLFADVNNVNTNYRTRLAAKLTEVKNLTTLVNGFANAISPTGGNGDTSALDDLIANYNAQKEALEMMAGDGLTEEEIEKMDPNDLSAVLNAMAGEVIDNLPSLKVGDKIEIPIAEGLSIYYSVSGKVDGNGDATVNVTVDGQKVKLKNISFKTSTDGSLKLSVEGDTEGGMDLSLSSDNASFKLNDKGHLEGTVSVTVGDDTYTVKLELGADGSVYEESIKTILEGGSVTSAIGIKKTNNGWKRIPVPEVVEEPCTLPQIDASDVDWQAVEIGGWVLVAGVVVIAVVASGGAAAPALAVVF